MPNTSAIKNSLCHKHALHITQASGFADGRADRYHFIFTALELFEQAQPKSIPHEEASAASSRELLARLEQFADSEEDNNGLGDRHLALVCGIACIKMSIESLKASETLLERVCKLYPQRPEPKVLLHLPLRLRDDDDRATKLCRQAADQAAQLSDARTEASASYHAAFLYACFEQYHSMVEYDDRAYAQVQKFDDPWLKALIWMRCSERLLKELKPKAALKEYDRAFAFLCEINDHFGAGFYYENRIQLNLQLGNTHTAEKLIEEARSANALPARELVNIAEKVADHAWDKKDYDNAQAQFEKAVALAHRYDHGNTARLTRRLADFIARVRVKPQQAVALLLPVRQRLLNELSQAEQAIAKQSASLEIVKTLHGIADVEIQRHRAKAALAYSEEALTIALANLSDVSDDATVQLSRCYRYLGTINATLKRYDISLQHWQKALDEAQKLAEHLQHERSAYVAENACTAAYRCGDRRQYLRWLTEAYERLGAIQSHEAAHAYIDPIRTTAAQAANPATLKPFIDTALASERQPYELGCWQHALAMAQLGQGLFNEAEASYNTAKAYANGLTGAHINWAIDYAEQLLLSGHPNAAVQCLEEASDDMQRNNYPAVTLHAQSILALACAQAGELDKALAFLKGFASLHKRVLKSKDEGNETRLIIALANESEVLTLADNQQAAADAFQRGLQLAVKTDSDFSMFFLLKSHYRFSVAFLNEHEQQTAFQLLARHRHVCAASNLFLKTLETSAQHSDASPEVITFDAETALHALRQKDYFDCKGNISAKTMAALETRYFTDKVFSPLCRFWLLQLITPLFEALSQNGIESTAQAARLSDAASALEKGELQPLRQWLGDYATDDPSQAAAALVEMIYCGYVDATTQAQAGGQQAGEQSTFALLLATQQSTGFVTLEALRDFTSSDNKAIAAMATTLQLMAYLNHEVNPYAADDAYAALNVSAEDIDELLASCPREYAVGLYYAAAKASCKLNNIERGYRLARLGRHYCGKIREHPLFEELGSELLSLEVDLQDKVSAECFSEVSALTKQPTPAWAKKVGRFFGRNKA